VLAAVERAHPGIVLGPDAEIFKAIDFPAGGQQLVQVSPIHADIVEGSIEAEGGEVSTSLSEKSGVFGLVHLARGHREGVSTPVES